VTIAVGPASVAANDRSALGSSIPGRDPRAHSRDISDLAARVVIGALFCLLAYRLGLDFANTQRVTSLLMLVSEALVVLLTIARRSAFAIDRSAHARLVTAAALVGPFLVRPGAPGAGLASEAVAATISACGIGLVVVAKLTLGRSFGVLPANRGVVASGVYRSIRHPIYAGYFLNDVGFLCSHPLAWNVFVLVGSSVFTIWRLLLEEKTLAGDPAYATYLHRVRWRLLPYVF
jgi:protein-S-isoprenylcysteine O-methyltransferase Ste14